MQVSALVKEILALLKYESGMLQMEDVALYKYLGLLKYKNSFRDQNEIYHTFLDLPKW